MSIIKAHLLPKSKEKVVAGKKIARCPLLSAKAVLYLNCLADNLSGITAATAHPLFKRW